MKEFFEVIKQFLWKFFGAIVSDTKPNGQVAVSLGRISFVSVLLFLFYFWYRSMSESVEIPPGIMAVFYTLSGYVFGTKTIETLRGLVGKEKDNE